PHYVPKAAAELARELRQNRVSAALRAPYDEWAAQKLGSNGVFVRAQVTLRGDNIDSTLFVRRGSEEEPVNAGENLVPVALLKKVPLFVDIKLLKEVGGWVEPRATPSP